MSKNKIVPNFLIGGAAKCGTTSLDYYLGEHSQFCMARPKEAHFFDTEKHYERGLDFYSTFWKHYTDEPFIGDTTPCYLHGQYIAERIQASLPDSKIIFIFRDPIERAYSNYWHGFRAGRNIGSFEQSIDDAENRFLWERSRYSRYLRDYFEIFGKDRVLCLLTEQLSAEPEVVLKKVYDFLGANFEMPTAIRKRQNTHWMPRSMALQRLRYRYFYYGVKPSDVEHFDELGKLIIRRPATGTSLARRATNWVSRKLNSYPTKYPPISQETASKLQRKLASDYIDFAELTDLDIGRWWKYAKKPGDKHLASQHIV